MKSWKLFRLDWAHRSTGLSEVTLALADIGSNSGSSKSKRTLSRKAEVTNSVEIDCDLLDDIAEGLGVRVAHEGRESREENVSDDPNTPQVN